MHDSCARIPLIVRFPRRFRKKSRCSTPTSLVDVFPTVIEAAGIDSNCFKPDGKDLAEVQAIDDRTVFSHFNNAENGLYMSLNKRWKYFYSAPDNKEFLFDMKKDPEETANVVSKNQKAGAEMRSSIICELRKAGEKKNVGMKGWKKIPCEEDACRPGCRASHTGSPMGGNVDRGAGQTDPRYFKKCLIYVPFWYAPNSP